MRLKWLRNYSNNDLPQEISIAKGWHWNAAAAAVAACDDDDTVVVVVVATSVIFTRWTLISSIRIGVKTILCSLVVYFNFICGLTFVHFSYFVYILQLICVQTQLFACLLSIDIFFFFLSFRFKIHSDARAIVTILKYPLCLRQSNSNINIQHNNNKQ